MKQRPPFLPLKNHSAFTLTEVMVTLAVVGAVAAIAAPGVLMMAPNMALKSAARDLYSNLQKARILAIKENQSISVRFSGTYYYIDRNRDGAYTASTVDTFTDVNGDGAYTRGEPYVDVDGNGAYSGETAINFTDYGYGVKKGTGTAAKNWSGNTCTQRAFITFNSRGTSNSGTIYLDNKNNDICYAVTARSSGSIKTRRYSGATPFNRRYWE
jgi:type IV fimbrial biogenesis protein FimT